MVHHLQRIAGLRHVDAGQRAPSAAHQVQIGAGAFPQPGHRPHIRLSDGAGADRIVAGALGQPDHPQPQRLRRRRGCRPQPHHLQRAAADIRQDAVRGGNAAQHALGRVAPPPRPRQHPDRHARHPLAQRGDELRPVPGIAHRGSGQHLERLRPHGPRHRVIAVQDGEGLRHAIVIQPAGGVQAAAQAQHRFLVEDAIGLRPCPSKPPDGPSWTPGPPHRSAATRQAPYRACGQSWFTRSGAAMAGQRRRDRRTMQRRASAGQ